LKKIFVICFIFILFGVPISTLIIPDITYSENENKYLAQKPNISVQNIISGKFMKDTSQYLNDQLAFRQQWLDSKTKIEKTMGFEEINGVYLGADNYLIEKWISQDIDERIFLSNVKSINDFAKKLNYPVNLIIVPTVGHIYPNKLPKYAPYVDQNKLFNLLKNKVEYIRYLDIQETLLKHSDEKLYYRTDHHWTTTGAFYAYQAFKNSKNEDVNKSDYHIIQVSNTFKGSMDSKVLNDDEVSDLIEIYNKDRNLSISYNFGKNISYSLYDYESLKNKDQYQFFLKGNHPELTIKTTVNNDKHLLIFKDSYANAFIPFLVDDYETIHVIDPRYYHGNLSDYMKNNNINECMFLYNLKNFVSDDSIQTVLE